MMAGDAKLAVVSALSGPVAPAGRLLGAAQLVVGLRLGLRPQQVAVRAAGSRGTPAPAWLVRVLGLRSLAQGAITLAAPTRTVLVAGAIVDAAHAASMVPLIAGSRRHRRAAAISALVAVLSCGAGAAAADHTPSAGGS